MNESRSVKVSPRHSVTIDVDYYVMILRAPRQDFVVRTLAKKMAGDSPLMTGDLVIAGEETREAFPLAKEFPLHFRKTFYTGRMRGDPKAEFEAHARASEVLGIPPPIGHKGGVFRSCLVPGSPYDKLTPFGSEPEESNLKHAEKLPLASAAGAWLLAESIFRVHTKLHAAGLAHGDAELHNFIVCPSPLEVVPIDFEMALSKSEVSEDEWERRCAADLEPLLRMAVYLMCTLGVQEGGLAELAMQRIDTVLARSAAFKQRIAERSGLSS